MGKSKSDRVDSRSLMLKAEANAAGKREAPELLPDVPELVDDCPTLNAYLTVRELNGKPRKTATLTFWVEDWGIKAVFSDRENKRKLWAEASSLIDLLKALESRLTADQVDWRSDAGTKWNGSRKPS